MSVRSVCSRGAAVAVVSFPLVLVLGFAAPAGAVEAAAGVAVGAVSDSGVSPDSEFAGKSFTGQVFDGADLSGRDLSGSHFDGAGMTRAVLDRAVAFRATFVNAVLVGASVAGTDFTYTSFEGADLSGVDFRAVGSLRGTVFAGAVLDGANFSGLDLDGANFTGAQLAGVILDDVTNVDPRVIENATQQAAATEAAKKAAEEAAEKAAAEAAEKAAAEAAEKAAADKAAAETAATNKMRDADVVIYSGILPGLHSAYEIGGRCPAEHPYVLDTWGDGSWATTWAKRLFIDRVYQGVTVSAGNGVDAHIKDPIWMSKAEMGLWGDGGILVGMKPRGSVTNWSFEEKKVTVTLHCTNDWFLAREINNIADAW